MNRNSGPETSGHQDTFPEQILMSDFPNATSYTPVAPLEDDIFFYTSFAAQREAGLNVSPQYDFDSLPATNPATNVPISGFAIPLDISTPLPQLQDSFFGSDWGGSSPPDQYSLSFANPIAFSLGNAYPSGSEQSPNWEPTFMAPHENNGHGIFPPGLGTEFDTPANEMLVVSNQDPRSWDPERLLNLALSQGSTRTPRLPPHLSEVTLGIPPASAGLQHLMSSWTNTHERQWDQDSFTIDALSLPSSGGAHNSLEDQVPSSPSTLAQSSKASSESQEATVPLSPKGNTSIPSTSQVKLMISPPGFSHSHILIVTNNNESSSSLWDGARLAELEKNSRLQTLDIKYQIPDNQERSSHGGSLKKRRMDERLQPGDSQHVLKGNDVPSYNKAPGEPTIDSSPPSVRTSAESAPSEVPRRRAPKRKTDAERQATAQVRKKSACLVCRIMKEKCSDTRPCPGCIKRLQSSKTMLQVPCQRGTLDDVELYRRRTQIGLFVYHYKYTNDEDLPLRTASIVDPGPLEAQLGQSCPLTVSDMFELQGFGMFQRFAPNLLNRVGQEKVLAIQRLSTLEDLKSLKVLAQYLELHIETIIDTLGTNNNFIATTLRVAEKYSRPERSKPSAKQMLRNALYIFAARFLRRTYWVQLDTASGDYRVAWMDAPWRALPYSTPKSLAEAETLNGILKSHLCLLEKWVIEDFTKRIYGRKREDWFEIFLVTFIFQVILSENLEMSFYSHFSGFGKPIECPWSTFGGLRSYSSKRIASYFSAINGRDPFLKPGARAWEGFGDTEREYLDQCGVLLKDGYTKRDDLGFRRSASIGDADSPGSWWKWAVETVLGEGLSSPS
ncbi:hypothetical protein B0T21DRAFT_408025 [Apiosordaria backusii]|uniref:Zn(2)-C6 fungal-type domain-containing protein n=1 Tax=Apiosordaria backusii TaxID=314023 RepID=A0AA40K3V5_9PEZI|nr:hypothetical protein B0T21DRAFT_408025 [Apiosordaria backusii]